MYYVLEADSRLAKKFIHFTQQPEGTDIEEWTTGRPLGRKPPVFVLSTAESEAGVFSDMILNRPLIPIVSPKLRGVLQELGVTNAEYFPIKLIDEARGVTRDDYLVMNVLGRIACLDVENSTVVKSRRGEHFTSVEEFKLFEDRIKPLPGSDAPPLMFRLDEYENYTLVHERVKRAFEEAGITGAGFTLPENVI
jgi:hypothetical protein